MLLVLMLGWALADTAPTPPAASAEPTQPAQPATAPASADIAGEEIVVWGERLESARSQLDVDLRQYGYHLRKVKNGWSIYARKGFDRWKPRVRVNGDGLLVFDDPRVLLMPPVAVGTPSVAAQTAPGLYSDPSGAPDRGDLSLQIPIIAPSARKQDQEKARVLEAIGPSVEKIQTATFAVAEAKLLSDLPAKLDALWHEGHDPLSDKILADPAARRAALVDLWVSRADTPAGHASRQVIETYLTEEVQTSPTPFSEAERTAAAGKGLVIH